jgi:hypothetical protein
VSAAIQSRIVCLSFNISNFEIHKTTILSVFLCGWETWSLTFLEVCRLKHVSEHLLLAEYN